RQARLGRAMGARLPELLQRGVERADHRRLPVDGPVVARHVHDQLARARVGPPRVRDDRHQPQQRSARRDHRRGGLAQQPPPLPVVRAPGVPLVAGRLHLLRPARLLLARRRPRPPAGSRRGTRRGPASPTRSLNRNATRVVVLDVKRRTRGLMVIVALAAFGLAGCGSSSKAPTTGSPGGTTPPPTPSSGGGGSYGY